MNTYFRTLRDFLVVGESGHSSYEREHITFFFGFFLHARQVDMHRFWCLWESAVNNITHTRQFSELHGCIHIDKCTCFSPQTSKPKCNKKDTLETIFRANFNFVIAVVGACTKLTFDAVAHSFGSTNVVWKFKEKSNMIQQKN